MYTKVDQASIKIYGTMNSSNNPSEQDDASKLENEATWFLDRLIESLPDMLAEHEENDKGFRVRCYERWKQGFDLLKMFIVVSEEFGSTINERERPAAFDKQDYKFEAVVMLHARGVRVANEILALLREGFPDGALSRWRTLHEIAVVTTFLNQNDMSISLRFLAHRGVMAYKALRQYDEFLPRSGMIPLAAGEIEVAKANRDQLIEEFGPEFAEEMGWAFPVIDKKRRINLFDLEVKTGLDHWRPRFKWASDDIHVGAKPPSASLGTSERERSQPVLLTGRSNSAFTDPAHMCVMSLNLANHAIPEEYLSELEKMLLVSLRILSDRLGQTFLEIDQRGAGHDPG